MNKDVVSKVDQTYDFGFTFQDEVDVEVIKETVTQDVAGSKDEVITDLKKRLASVGKMVLPLLEQLNQKPEMPMIKWENRKPILDKHIKQIKALVEV